MVRQATESTSSPSRQHGQSGQSGQRWRLPPARNRVSLPWVTFGLLLVVGAGLAGVVVINQVDQRQMVLMVARPVEIGQPIGELDVTTVKVSAGSEVAALPADDADVGVVGRPAAIRLSPGMLLVPEAVGPPAGLAAGEALVGIALETGRFPPELTAGASVQVVATGSADQTAPGQPAAPGRVLVGQARVLAVHAQPEQPGGASVVTLQVPLGAAEPVTSAAAAGRVALAQIPPDAQGGA